MPKFVEVIYETGRSSVMQVEDEAEAMRGIAEQHRRAMSGELAGPAGGPAERVHKALIYDRHPHDYNLNDSLSADELKATLPGLIDSLADENGYVRVGQLSQEVRALTSPTKRDRQPHESMFLMEEESTITTADIESAASGETPEAPTNGEGEVPA